MPIARRALAGLAVSLLAAGGAVLAAPSAQADSLPIGCSEPQRILAATGWFTVDAGGVVRADAADAPDDVAQWFRFCEPPDWQRPQTVLRSEAAERYLAPSLFSGQVRATSSSPTSANVVEVQALDGGSIIKSASTGAYYDARDDLAGAPVYATAGVKDAEVLKIVPVK